MSEKFSVREFSESCLRTASGMQEKAFARSSWGPRTGTAFCLSSCFLYTFMSVMSKALIRISNVFKGDLNCFARDKDVKYLQIDLKQYPFELSRSSYVVASNALARESSSNKYRDDDASSISSVSTNATMDNIPGPGRTIDTYIYQFFGRKLERFIFRISISSFSPDKIVQCLCIDGSGPWPPGQSPLGDVIQAISADRNLCCEPRARVAGVKSLVKQSQ